MRRVLLYLIFFIVSLSAKALDFEQDGIYYETRTDGLWVVRHSYIGDIIIPSTVTYEGTEYGVVGIGDDAFRVCNGLTSITIPNSVTSIGNYAFCGCSSLTSITIPNGVVSIGHGAFTSSALTSITIPNSVTSIGESAFYFCKNLKKVIIPDIVGWCEHSILYYNSWSSPFSNGGDIYSDENTKITNLVIPECVTFIGDNTFCGCSSLTSITIPNGVISIGDYAFQNCSSLTSITIPNSVTSIGKSTFWGCSSLTSITIPNSVTSIGDYAFQNCSGLTSITIPNSVTSIVNSPFGGCSGLTSVTLHCSIITSYLFKDLPSIQEIILGEEVTTISGYAFLRCSGLTSITIPNSVTSIGDYAFCGCSGLTSITIPNSVYLIKEGAFKNCTHLKTVDFGKSVERIGERIFEKCDELTSIVSNNPNPPSLGKDSFQDKITSNVILYVPKGSEEAYKNAKGWKNFRTIKAIGEADNTDNSNTDDTTTDDNNTDDNKTDDGISDGDSGWSINIKIKGEDIAQCSIDNIESIEFTEDGLYIIINYKDGKSAKYDMSKFESIDFSEKGGNNEDVDDVETNEESNQGQMSLKIDDESFYAVNCTAEQTSNSGMYLHIKTTNDLDFPYFGKELTIHISPSKVAELKEGDVFGANKLNVKSFKSADLIIINGTKWNELEGNITIKKITDMEMTIVINDLQIENDSSKVKHTIRGTAVLTSGVYDSKGNLLSFKNAIE